MQANRRFHLATAVAFALGAASFATAQDRPNTAADTPRTDTRNNDNSAGRPAADRPADRADRSTDARPSAGGSTASREDTQGVSEVLGRTVEAALSGKSDQLAENFYRADRERFQGDAAQAAARDANRLQESITQVKRAYRDKYNQDLTLADSGKLFGGGFVTTGGTETPGERARPAGARQDPQSGAATTGGAGATGGATAGSTGTSGSGNAGAATGADAATSSEPRRDTASATGRPAGAGGVEASNTAGVPQVKTASIPASHGLPAVQFLLVQEGNGWKLNVPDTLTPQRLQDNLIRHLNMANSMRDQWPADANQAQQALAHHIMLAVTDRQNDDPTRGRTPADGASGTGTGTGAGGTSR
jgi:hypothetical protein